MKSKIFSVNRLFARFPCLRLLHYEQNWPFLSKNHDNFIRSMRSSYVLKRQISWKWVGILIWSQHTLIAPLKILSNATCTTLVFYGHTPVTNFFFLKNRNCKFWTAHCGFHWIIFNWFWKEKHLIVLEHQSNQILPLCSVYLTDSDQKQYLTISIDYTISIFVSMVSMDYHYIIAM